MDTHTNTESLGRECVAGRSHVDGIVRMPPLGGTTGEAPGQAGAPLPEYGTNFEGGLRGARFTRYWFTRRFTWLRKRKMSPWYVLTAMRLTRVVNVIGVYGERMRQPQSNRSVMGDTMPDPFWTDHVTYAEAARMLGCTRMNVSQQAKRGVYGERVFDPVSHNPAILRSKIEDILFHRGRDKQATRSVALRTE